MKKKVLLILAILTVAMSLSACGGNVDADNSNSTKSDVEAPSIVKSDDEVVENNDSNDTKETSGSIASEHPGYYIQTAGMPTESKSDSNIGFYYTTAKLDNVDISQFYGYKVSDHGQIDEGDYDSLPLFEDFIEGNYDSAYNKIYVYDKEYSEYVADYGKYRCFAEIHVDNYDGSATTIKECLDNNWYYVYGGIMSDTIACDSASDVMSALFENAGAPDEFFIRDFSKDVVLATDFAVDTPEQIAYALFNTPANDYRGTEGTLNMVYYALCYKMDNNWVVLRIKDKEANENLKVEFVDCYIVPDQCYEAFKTGHINDNGELVQVSMDDVINAIK